MIPSYPPPKPPDPLVQALNPADQILANRLKVEAIMKKYGREPLNKPVPAQPRQWEGDPNG